MADPLMPTVEVERKEDGSASVSVLQGANDVIATPLEGFLQVKDPTTEERTHLKEIWEYIKGQSKSELVTEQLWTLRHIEERLSAPRLGQTRVDQLYQYITTDKQVRSAEKLRDSFLK